MSTHAASIRLNASELSRPRATLSLFPRILFFLLALALGIAPCLERQAEAGLAAAGGALPPLALADIGVPENAASVETPAAGGKSQQVAPGATPEGLKPGEWKSIQEQIREAQYHPAPVGESGDYAAPNQAQNVRTHFARDGEVQFNTRSPRLGADDSEESPESLSLHLSAYGYGDELQPVPPAESPVADKNRVEYRRGDIVEWYVNDERGVEQGFTLQAPPSRSPGLGPEHARPQGRTPLNLALSLDTALTPELNPDAQGVVFKNTAGQVVFTYDKLHVVDAEDKVLPAYFSLADAGEVRIVVDDSAAVYPLVVDPLITAQQGKFNRIYTDAGDRFGTAVALDGTTLLVGAPYADSCTLSGACPAGGAAYVFIASGSEWLLQAQLSTSDATAGQKFFGLSVALSNDTALIGAFTSAYVFVRNGTAWSQQAKLPIDTYTSYPWASSVALSGDTALIGADNDTCQGDVNTYCGSAYVFVRNGTAWSQQARLTAADGANNDQFGHSVALSGNNALISAIYDDDGCPPDDPATPDYDESACNTGSVYVFTQDGSGNWSQQVKLIADDAEISDYFGKSVALSGDTALIGAIGSGVYAGGAAYVFTRGASGNWGQQTKLVTDSYLYGTSSFGSSVALNGDIALIGATTEPCAAIPNSAYCGAAYVFIRDASGNWSQQAELTAGDGAHDDNFGAAVALSGNTVLIGAPISNSYAGSAYVFTSDGISWSQQAKLTTNDAGALESFGYSVALDGDTALIGAYGDSDGSAYVFVRDGAVWRQQAKLVTGQGQQQLGYSVALSGDTALIGAILSDNYSGAAYAFVRNTAGNWSQQAKLTASDGAATDYFGYFVALSGDTALVSAPYHDGNGADSGAAYVFARAGTAWSQQAKLVSNDAAASDWLGMSIALSGDTALLGSHGKGCSTNFFSCGAAYVFTRSGAVWSQQVKLTSDTTTYFGLSVTLDGDTALIGDGGSAYVFTRNDSVWSQQAQLRVDGDYIPVYTVLLRGDTAFLGSPQSNSSTGAVYVFMRNGETWSQQAKLTANDAAGGDQFGITLALSGNTALIGAPGNSDGASNAGSAYIFDLKFINNAPVLDTSGAMRLNALDEDSADNPGTLISELIVSATGDRITDTDIGALGQEGIAITQADNSNGAWQYSLDNGAAWLALGSPSASSARLLAADTNTRLRFVPGAADFNTVKDPVPLLTFHAWDQTNACHFPNADPATCKLNGSTADVSIIGDAAPYSFAQEEATAVVNPVSDPIVFTATPGNQVVVRGSSTPTLLDILVDDPQDNPVPNTLRYDLAPMLSWAGMNASHQAAFSPQATTALGQYSFTVAVTETNGVPQNYGVSQDITVSVLPTIPGESIPLDTLKTIDFTKGTSYPGLTFSLQSGAGSITAAGLYSWTPTAAGTNTLTVRATDGVSGQYAEQSVTLTAADYVLNTTIDPVAFQGSPIKQPYVTGTASYDDTDLARVELALQNGACAGAGQYAAVAGGQFSTFTSATAQWLAVPLAKSFSSTPASAPWNALLGGIALTPQQGYCVYARAVDSAEHLGTEQSLVFTYPQGDATTLTLETSSPALLHNATDFWVTGKLSTVVQQTGDLSGLNITLHVTRPDNSVVTLSKATHTDTGQYEFTPADSGFPAFDLEGAYLFQAEFTGSPNLEPSASNEAVVMVGQSAGYAILIQGKIPNNEGLASHYKSATRIYNHLKKRGFEDQNIEFFSYANVTGTEKLPSRAAIAGAFDRLAGKMEQVPAPLYVIMVDHGGVDGSFYIDNESITPEDLKAALDSVEARLAANKPEALLKPRIVTVGACYSGGFINTLSQAPVAGSNAGRLIITSAAGNEVSYKGPDESDGVRSGELFLEEFFNQLVRGQTFKGAFEQAVDVTENSTRGSANSVSAYNDTALQHPLLDDDGDGRGSNVLAAGGDGGVAEDWYLGAVLPSGSNFGGSPAEILGVSETQFISSADTGVTLKIQVNNALRVSSALVDIRQPQAVLNAQIEAVTGQAVIDETVLKRQSPMQCSQLDNTCTLNISGTAFTNVFGAQAGMYEVFYFVRDAVTYEISPIKRSLVYKTLSGNQPPAAFSLATPLNNSGGLAACTADPPTAVCPQTVMLLNWADAPDPEGQAVTYTLLLAGDSAFNNIVYRRENLISSMAGIGADAVVDDGRTESPWTGLLDKTTYYWKVQAIDAYGAVRDSTETWRFTTNNPNIPPNLASLAVISAATYEPVADATVDNVRTTNNEPMTPEMINDLGQYNLVMPNGTYLADVSGSGFTTMTVNIDLSQGDTSQQVQLMPTGGIPLSSGTLQFTEATQSVQESAGLISIPVQRVGGSDGAVSVAYSVSTGSAVAGSDFESTNGSLSGTLNWSAYDVRARTIPLNILDDSLAESGEIFTVTLSGASGGAVLGTAGLQVTIADNDTAPPPPVMPETLQFSQSFYNGAEGGVVTVTVNRGGAAENAVSVDYTTMDNDSALAGSDYVAAGGPLTWASGDTTPRSFTLTLSEDSAVEGNETFVLMLNNPTGGVALGDRNQALVVIGDNDTPPLPGTSPSGILEFSQVLYSVTEGAAQAAITVERRDGGLGTVSVDYATLAGTNAYAAQADVDYMPVQGTLTWANGDNTAKSFLVPLVNDSLDESNEFLNMQLSVPTNGALLGPNSAAVLYLVDDDGASGTSATGLPSGTESPCLLSGTIDRVCNAQGQTLGEVTVTANGRVSNGFLSGTLVNGGILSNITLLPGAQLSGGKLHGYVASISGTVRDVYLSTGTYLSGGTLGGAIQGSGLAYVENTVLGDGTYLANLIIGENVEFTGNVILGQGVRFARAGLIPEGYSLLWTLPALAGNCDGIDEQHLPRVSLSADVVEGGPGLLARINALPLFHDNGWTVRQDGYGNLYLELGNRRYAVKPSMLYNSGRPAGLEVLDGERVRLGLGNGLELLAQPAVQNPCALGEALADMHLGQASLLADGNLRVNDPHGIWYSARPSWSADTVAGALDAPRIDIRRSPYTGPLAWLHFDSDGQHREQALYPALAQPQVIAEIVDELTSGEYGLAQARLGERVYRAIPQYPVVPGTADQRFSVFDPGDLDGDGLPDLGLIYPDGARQNVFMSGD